MPNGKPAGVRCVQLRDDLQCAIFGMPSRPACCSGLQPQAEMCGASREEAIVWLTRLEAQTQPQSPQRREPDRPSVRPSDADLHHGDFA